MVLGQHYIYYLTNQKKVLKHLANENGFQATILFNQSEKSTKAFSQCEWFFSAIYIITNQSGESTKAFSQREWLVWAAILPV
jgi:hypothetical protein